jgi:hypothetical protein
LALLASPHPLQGQTGTITGQLLNDRGLPVAGVRVAAMPVPREGDTSTGPLVGLTLTDSNGRYTIETLEPGTYYVTAGLLETPSYYPGVGTLSSAKSILLPAGARLSGIDFKTVQPVTHSVSGRVVLLPGQKLLPGYRMALTGDGSLEAPVNPDGAFEFNRVPPGQYTLRLATNGLSASMPLVVDGRLTGIEFRPSSVFVNGNVVMEDGSDAATASVTFRDIKQNRLLEVAARKTFALLVPEGEFRVAAKRLPTGYEVKSLTAGSVDLLSNSLKLSSNEPVVAIAMTLKPAPTVSFTGRAVSARGVLQPVRSIRMEAGESTEPTQGTVQPDGSFAFDRISPGEYTAAVLVAGSQESRVKVVVPPEGRRDAEILIPELRQFSARLTIEPNVPASAHPVVTLRFVEAAGNIGHLAIDGSSVEAPLKFSLSEGQYRVTATIRESGTGAGGTTRVKTLTSGTVNLLTSPLNAGGTVEELRITIGQ